MLDDFLVKLFENLMALMPFVILHSYEMGCRWTLGKNPIPLDAGIHWKVWLIHSIDVVSIADDAIELQIQSVITQDEKLVCFKVGFAYRVKDVVAHCNNVQDFLDSTETLARLHLAKRVRERNLNDLLTSLPDLEKSLRGTLSTKFRDWGTEVFDVGFTDFAEVPTQIRLFHDGGLL